MTIPTGILIVGIAASVAFLFTRVDTTGSGPISIRGATSYDRTYTVKFGLLEREWSSLKIEDKYDGAHHYSSFLGGIQSSANWWFGLTTIMSGIAYYVLRKR